MDPITLIGVLAAAGVVTILSALRVLFEYQRGVIFRLGKLVGGRGPGLIFLLPFGIERMRKMDLRIIALDIPPQDTITKDNVSVTVNAVVYFRVADPTRAVVEIEDYYFATSQLAQTTLRSVIGQSELDDLLAERDRINDIVRKIIDAGTDPWGIEVTGVEIKDIGLPPEMKRAMARQAEAERERRAKVISAEGEFQASRRLSQAAQALEKYPAALQLRFLQTVVEIAAENNSTTLFPIPIDMFRPFAKQAGGGGVPSERDADADAASDASLALPGASELLESLGVDLESALKALPEGASRTEIVSVARRALGLSPGSKEEEEDSALRDGER
ncbi:MAG: slipin family protein [Longimicrobiales bacterium]|nr:slipin family protein [Longimicrobiales bacterium]